MVVFQIRLQNRRHGPVGKINRRAKRQLPVELSGVVDKAKQFRRLLRHGNIHTVDPLGQGRAVQRIGIEHGNPVPAAAQFLRNGPARRVVSAAGAAG